MNSILKIYRSAELPDYNKSGYFGNFKTALQFAPSVKLLPFFERLQAYTGYIPAVTGFYLQGLDCDGNIMQTFTLDETKIDVSNINSQIIISYDAGSDLLTALTQFQEGIYQYYIGMNTEKFYTSEPFRVTYSNFITTLGDFDPLDFNDDFLT